MATSERDKELVRLSLQLQDILGLDDDDRAAIEEAMQEFYNLGHDAGAAAERALKGRVIEFIEEIIEVARHSPTRSVTDQYLSAYIEPHLRRLKDEP